MWHSNNNNNINNSRSPLQLAQSKLVLTKIVQLLRGVDTTISEEDVAVVVVTVLVALLLMASTRKTKKLSLILSLPTPSLIRLPL
jgi:hypothetical protein